MPWNSPKIKGQEGGEWASVQERDKKGRSITKISEDQEQKFDICNFNMILSHLGSS